MTEKKLTKATVPMCVCGAELKRMADGYLCNTCGRACYSSAVIWAYYKPDVARVAHGLRHLACSELIGQWIKDKITELADRLEAS